MADSIDFRVLERGDLDILAQVAPGVFDHPVDRECAEQFLADPHLHLAVALADGEIVGFASGVDYIHPDKPREMWINEVGVAPHYRHRGVGKGVMNALIAKARALNCREAWVLTEADNLNAAGLYQAVGGHEERPGQRMFVFPLAGAIQGGSGDGVALDR